MDDMDQGGAGGAPLDDDTPQDRRRRPGSHRAQQPGTGRERHRGERGAADEDARDGEAGDALSPSPQAQRRTARGPGPGHD
ncbi:hypothetical protein C0216_16870 [Streptomyces globosus]|uniref:Uncharacterized protein n=1 Tax=Streptomyces globosus TaxID=68209 RepID=A0A344U1Y1_9ACTN|nr:MULTISPECIES: hypothetical protein [Streptomyces]AXE24902.1 hypothetical protein C0216_16870 [Streptomyces globosus]